MGNPGDPEAANQLAAEHIARTRKRLAESKAELDRVQESMRKTSEHIDSVSAWIDETERHLRETRDA